MGVQSLFSTLLCFIAAVHAAQLTVRSPRLTVFGPDGNQLNSKEYATHLSSLLVRKEITTTRTDSPSQNALILSHWVRVIL